VPFLMTLTIIDHRVSFVNTFS